MRISHETRIRLVPARIASENGGHAGCHGRMSRTTSPPTDSSRHMLTFRWAAEQDFLGRYVTHETTGQDLGVRSSRWRAQAGNTADRASVVKPAFQAHRDNHSANCFLEVASRVALPRLAKRASTLQHIFHSQTVPRGCNAVHIPSTAALRVPERLLSR